jgi:hypothetical protein
MKIKGTADMTNDTQRMSGAPQRSCYLGLAALLLAVAGCTSSPPYRTQLRAEGECDDAYSRARWNEEAGRKNAAAETERLQKQIRSDLGDAALSACWHSATEHHATYDLYTVEFDDQGWLAGTALHPNAPENELTVLMKELRAMTRVGPGTDPRPLSIVIYTHGWHHSAKPDDANVIAFRRLLEAASVAERELCLTARNGRATALEEAPAEVCAESEPSVPLRQKKRRVVGIYVGWRGDSVVGPLIEDTSIWDRKHTAETVALGSVQEFFSLMHEFYLEHACHEPTTPPAAAGAESVPAPQPDTTKCAKVADVRMLTIGHSFGGLITYRALEPRMMLGIAETAPHEPGQKMRYAYGFGDLIVLINPAFEATRFEALAEAAASRDYIDSGGQVSAQLPMLIVATSKSDRATGVAFPAFRWATTRFEHTDGAEESANIHTVGWESRYRTHFLTLSTDADVCGLTSASSDQERLLAEAKWSEQQQAKHYADFGASSLDLCDSLRLSSRPDWALTKPAFMPVWNIQADSTVIDGHNDFLNVHLVDFVRQVYYTILREEDVVMRR